jgi:cysteine desulfurase/selenocysteine lyase
MLFEQEFPLDSHLIYLNHAAVSPWPKRTARAVEAFARENMLSGAAAYPRWLETEKSLREKLSWLINASSVSDISLMKNTSEALSVVAYGLDWSPGDNIVTFAQEFPSNRMVWQSLARFGVETCFVDLDITQDPEQALFNACDENTRLVSSSSVQYASGMRMDLPRIGQFCRERGILFCVDAIQSLGALPFDRKETGADFVVADGHKWMLGPEGLALLYTHPEVRPHLKLHQFGWHMTDNTADFDSLLWHESETGTRFECGSPNMLGIHALNASLKLIRDVGLEEISGRILQNSRHIIERVKRDRHLELRTSPDEPRISGIVNFRVRGRNPYEIYRSLMERGIICALRGGGIRFSPHFYTSIEKIDEAMDAVPDICK